MCITVKAAQFSMLELFLVFLYIQYEIGDVLVIRCYLFSQIYCTDVIFQNKR